MLNLKALEQAFSGINDIGKGTISCDVDGSTVILSALMPNEEVTVQRYAAIALEEGRDSISANSDYLDRFQAALLAHAIVSINGMDLSSLTHIETGELLPNGVAVKIPRYEAVRKIVNSWSRIVRQYLFKHYAELMERIDLESDRLIKYEPVDIDTEIERLEERLKEMQERKAEKEKGDEARHPFRQQVETMKVDNVVMVPQQEEPAPVASPTMPTAPLPPRQASVVPDFVPPPAKRQQEPSPSEVLDNIERGQQEAAQSNDLDADLQAEMDAENARLLRVRQAQMAQRHAQQHTPQETHARRQPPHMAAQEDNDGPDDSIVGVGQIGGIDAYRVGAVPTLTEKGNGQRTGQAAIDQSNVNKGTLNPRFRKG